MKNLFLFFFLVGCSQVPTISKKNIVFIQGYHLDETSWDEVIRQIPPEEFTIQTISRAGRDLNTPASLNFLAATTCKKIIMKSILVAHSYGGAISTAMYGLCPEKISKIIYVSAIIPKNGELPFERMKDKKAQKNYAKAVTFDGKKITPREPEKFYAAMDPAVDLKMPKLPKLYSEWMSLTTEVVNYDAEQFRSLPKSYIATERDPIVSLRLQQGFSKEAGIQEFKSIPTGHFPMIAKPELLVEMILAFARM